MTGKSLSANRVPIFLVSCVVVSVMLTACTATAPSPPPGGASQAKPTAVQTGSEQSKAASSAPGPAAKTIKIGAMGPLTGPAAALGVSARRGMDFAAEQINSTGGIKSMGGAKLELVHEDHQMKPDVAVGIAERLVQNDNVPVLIGSMISAVTLATTQAAERLKTPHLVPLSTADEITERGFKYTFRVSGNNSWLAEDQLQVVKWLAKSKGLKIERIGLLYEDTAFGQSAAETQKKVFTKQEGFDVVADVSYSAQGRDFTSVIARLKTGAPDVVLSSSYTADAILLKRTMSTMDFKTLLFGTDGGVGNMDYIKNLGQLAEGDISIPMFNQDLPLPGMAAFVNAAKAKYGEPLDSQATFNFQAVLILKEALEKAGTDDKEAIRKALSETNLVPGPSLVLPAETFRFDEKGQGNVRYVAVQIQKGGLVTVWPEKFKAGEIILR